MVQTATDVDTDVNFSCVMSSNQLQLMRSCWHFNDSALRAERENPNCDLLFKRLSLLDKETSNVKYYPHKNLTGDELLVSRDVSITEDCLGSTYQLHDFRIKNFALTYVKTNYTYLWDVYTTGAHQFDGAEGIANQLLFIY